MDETAVSRCVTFNEATLITKETTISLPSQRAIVDGTHGSQFQDRLRVYTDNRLPKKNSLSIWKLFWGAYNDRILFLLTIAAGVSLALGIYESVGQQRAPGEPQPVDWVEGLAILIAIMIIVLVTGLNDYRREKQFVKLNEKKEDRQVKAIRSGRTVEISVFDVLVGEVLHLESGDSIPADGLLITGYGVRCDESSATGESDAMRKTGGEEVMSHINKGGAMPKLDPFIISGSKVLEGAGTFLVTSVGVNSSYGKIMMSLQTDNEDTPLQVKLAGMANWIGYLGSAAAGLLFLVLLIRFLAGLAGNNTSAAMKGSAFMDILIVAITIIVVAVPEGLPLAVTLALSYATKRMLKENNLVRHLRACETMGNATTICSDKTGTLTQNQMTVVAGTLGTGTEFARSDSSNVGNGNIHTVGELFATTSSPVKDLLMKSISINSTAFEGQQDGEIRFIGSKTETALLVMAREHLGMRSVAEERADVKLVQLFPFDSARKCMGAVIRLPQGGYRLLVKGAAELMLEECTSELDLASTLLSQPLAESARRHAFEKITEYAQQSLRTIAFVYRDFQQWPPHAFQVSNEEAKHTLTIDDVLSEMTFIGLVGIQDPLREGVSHSVKRCQDAGVTVRMVTGDNLITATAIAIQCGIKTPQGLSMEGPKFRTLSDPELNEILPRLQVLARSSPEDKRILVTKLKDLGETVAVTGDGTNDGPALKAADIGFSMGLSGTEVAKEASAIILMDDNFSSIVRAIMWGRSVNDAVSKFLQFQITVNITAVVLAFVSAVSSPESHSVLSAVQLLWVNLIMDTFAALALATDAPTEGILDRKPSPKRANLITTNMWKMIVGQAAYQLVVTFTLYFAGPRILGYDVAHNNELQTKLNTIVFNTFVWMQIFNEFNSRRLDNKFNIFEGVHRNVFFIIINMIMIGGQIMIIFVGGKAFQITRIDSTQWAICILCSLPCLLWSVVLRCIPDKYAEVVFTAAHRTWLVLYRPVIKVLSLLWRPIGVAGRAIKRVSKRALTKVKRGGKAQASDSVQVDEEALPHGFASYPPISSTTPLPDLQPKLEREKEQNQKQESRQQQSPQFNLPPIILTTVE